MSRRNANNNDETMCVICDLWWLWLLIFVLIVAAILTRDYWLPIIGAPGGTVTPTVIVPTPTMQTPQAATPRPASTSTNTPTIISTATFTPTARGPLTVGSRAPDFTLPNLGGGEISLRQQTGKPVLLVFFATFNSYSQAEAATLRQLAQTYTDKLVILPINFTYNDSMDDVNKFIKDYKWDFPVGLDETGSAMTLYEQDSIPSHVFINKDGIIVSIDGILTADQLEQKTGELLTP